MLSYRACTHTHVLYALHIQVGKLSKSLSGRAGVKITEAYEAFVNVCGVPHGFRNFTLRDGREPLSTLPPFVTLHPGRPEVHR